MSAIQHEEDDPISPVHNSRESPHTRGQQVARFLASVENGADNRSFTVEEEERVLRRIDLRVLPLLLGAYFFQQLDNSFLHRSDPNVVTSTRTNTQSSDVEWDEWSNLHFMPDSPMEAKFLSDREKYISVERLRANQMGIVSREWRWDHVWETLYDMKTWCWSFLVLSISIPSGGISSFGNLIIESFGYTNFESILFNLPLGAIQIIAIVGGGWLATRFKMKGMIIALFAALSTIGTILMLVIPRSNKGVLLFGYYMVSTLAAITPIIYAWEAQNTAGDTKRKFTSAIVLVIGPQLFQTSQAPAYRPGLIACLIMFILVGIFAILTDFYLIILNKKHAKKRKLLGKSAVIVDKSMLAKDEIQHSKAVEVEDINEQQASNTTAVDNEFADTTDLQNEDFIYAY
ncbi:major facilitator superfamily domain-containing protein [Penicillium malachiteum]|uniref:major facilitator superfamily domain-containing protein n=1 Tax=Penicillium malachiteum TaxID=1324776 RepID=UPI002547B441|nr:major facilitator superfamily domain-containing protein [Penicillium malachiteum]KAJ5721242.1 major facilitator superfamily domain-containing protein [Penicillium malachiteum]